MNKKNKFKGRITKGLFTSLNQDWKTPKRFYQELNKEFKFDFDPCPSNTKFNGLEIEWGKRNFVNPPYKYIYIWIKKGFEEFKKGKTVVFLIPSRTDTKWWHEFILPYAKEIRFIKGRLCFNDDGKPAPFPSCVVIFKK